MQSLPGFVSVELLGMNALGMHLQSMHYTMVSNFSFSGADQLAVSLVEKKKSLNISK